MALSTDEENKVREIIEAFTNGKRLSDLPDVSGNNPFKLLCEVLEDGESKKAALAAMLPYMEWTAGCRPYRAGNVHLR